MLSCKIDGKNIADVIKLPLSELRAWIAQIEDPLAKDIQDTLHTKLSALIDIGLGYLSLDRGLSTLSGGERQRISIARAILKNAPVIILDEATSSIDPENERQLQMAIEELTKEKTVIMIAHRLKTIRGADQIIVLDKGKIVQTGTHKELLAQPGIYSDFIAIRQKAIGWKL